MSPNIDPLTPRNMRWKGHVEGRRNAYKILMENPEGKKI
jgi:hypothetical protein